MSTTDEIHVGETIRFETTIYNSGTAMDISAASLKQWHFQDPNDGYYEKNASFITDGTDGGLFYQADTTFLSVSGKWQYQIKLVIGSFVYYSDITKFTVKANLPK